MNIKDNINGCIPLYSNCYYDRFETIRLMALFGKDQSAEKYLINSKPKDHDFTLLVMKSLREI